MKTLSKLLAVLSLVTAGSTAFASECGQATQELLAAQQAYNQATSAYNNVNSICAGNVFCNKAIYDNLVDATRNLQDAANAYNRACH